MENRNFGTPVQPVNFGVAPLRYTVEGSGGISYPQKAGDAGYDLSAAHGYVLYPGVFYKISTGVSLELPPGMWGDVRVRSSLGIKCVKLASSGVIDNGYRGIIYVPVQNDGHDVIQIRPGERIAQLILMPILHAPLERIEKLSETDRGVGGFGSTGR